MRKIFAIVALALPTKFYPSNMANTTNNKSLAPPPPNPHSLTTEQFEQARRIISSKARAFFIRNPEFPIEREDVEQNLWLDIIEAFAGYDPAKGTWTAHVSALAQQGLLRLLKHTTAKKRNRGRRPQSLDACVSANNDGRPATLADITAGSSTIAAEELSLDVREVLGRLSAQQQRIAAAILQGDKLIAVAIDLEITPHKLRRELDEIAIVFEKAGLSLGRQRQGKIRPSSARQSADDTATLYAEAV